MKTKRRSKIEYKKTTAGNQRGKWRFTVKGGNGEILSTGEGHTSKTDARRAVITLGMAIFEAITAEGLG